MLSRAALAWPLPHRHQPLRGAPGDQHEQAGAVEGVDVSHGLNCGEYFGTPDCNQAKIDSGLQELHRLGVSTFFPIHKFDNAFQR
jgi:hypothetical protein